MCKALAHKLAIRLGDRYSSGQLLEINAHSLFSKVRTAVWPVKDHRKVLFQTPLGVRPSHYCCRPRR